MTAAARDARPGGGRTRRLGMAVRLAVSALLLAWLLARVDVLAAARLLSAVQPPLLAAAVLSVVATHAISCLRWRWCLLEEGRKLRWRTLALSYWTALFVGLALPTEYGGDLLRIKDVWSRVGSGSTAVASVLWGRLSGLGATLLVFSLVGAWQLERLAELSAVWLWGAVLAACGMLAAAVASPRLSALGRRLAARGAALGIPGARRLLGLLGRLRTLARHRVYAWRIAVLALASQVLAILTNSLYAWSLAQPVTISEMALVVPLVTLSSLLPASFGGLGVKEGVFVVCLSALSLSPEGALSVALLNRLIALALALGGGILFPFRHRLLEPPEGRSGESA